MSSVREAAVICWPSLVAFEEEFEGCNDLYRFAVDQVWLEAPGLHCLNRGGTDVRGPAEGLSADYLALFGDGGHHFDCSVLTIVPARRVDRRGFGEGVRHHFA